MLLLVVITAQVKDQPKPNVWWKQDAIVPLSAGEFYQHPIAGFKLTILEDYCHRHEIEKPAEFVQLVRGFLSEA